MASFEDLILGFPLPVSPAASAVTFANHSLDGSTDQTEFVFQARDVAAITHVGFRFNALTGTSPTYIASIQSNNNGVPSGIVVGGVSPASATFTATGMVTTKWQWIALANSYTPARGEVLWIVIAYSSGTIDALNFMSITSDCDFLGTRVSFPRVNLNNAGVRTLRTTLSLYGYKTASRTYGNPLETITETQYSSDSIPDEYAIKFTWAAATGATNTVKGIRFLGRGPAAAKTILVTLYDGTTPLQTVTIDTDIVNTASAFRSFDFIFDETTLSTLTVGSTYRLGMAPQEIACNFAILTMLVAGAGDLSAYPGGAGWCLSTRTDSGAWTDVTDGRPIAGLIMDDWTEPSGGAGGIMTHPGMVGGMRG